MIVDMIWLATCSMASVPFSQLMRRCGNVDLSRTTARVSAGGLAARCAENRGSGPGRAVAASIAAAASGCRRGQRRGGEAGGGEARQVGHFDLAPRRGVAH